MNKGHSLVRILLGLTVIVSESAGLIAALKYQRQKIIIAIPTRIMSMLTLFIVVFLFRIRNIAVWLDKGINYVFKLDKFFTKTFCTKHAVNILPVCDYTDHSNDVIQHH